MIHDLAIVGGGIAAAAAAIALQDAGDVLSACLVAPPGRHDARTLERIGETLSPGANPILRELGLWEEFQRQGHRPARATFSAWGHEQLAERNAFAQLEGAGWHVDRARFEAWLWSCALERQSPQGPAFFRVETSVRQAEWRNGIWHLTLADGRSGSARFLLDCTGRRAAIAQTLAPRRRDDQLTAACAFLEKIDHGVEATPATLIEAQPDGWWYSALVPDGRLVVAFFFDPDLLPPHLARDAGAWRGLVESTHYTRWRIESAGFALGAVAPVLFDASTRWLETIAGENWAAAGDAAAALDPLSSHGMTLALWSGRRAALAARHALGGDATALRDYAASFAAGVANYRAQRRHIYALERRFADRPFWSRRATVANAPEPAEPAANRP